MTRRANGEGGLRWSESRQRWIAEVTVGYNERDKRKVRSGSAKTKTDAGRVLRRLIRERDAGLRVTDRSTVAEALDDFLRFGLPQNDGKTVVNYEGFCRLHIAPLLGTKGWWT